MWKGSTNCNQGLNGTELFLRNGAKLINISIWDHDYIAIVSSKAIECVLVLFITG